MVSIFIVSIHDYIYYLIYISCQKESEDFSIHHDAFNLYMALIWWIFMAVYRREYNSFHASPDSLVTEIPEEQVDDGNNMTSVRNISLISKFSSLSVGPTDLMGW